jgi:MoxR-like ATPase
MNAGVTPDPLTWHETLRAQLTRMERGLLERDVAVRATLLAALAGEHVLLIGPPGTAKSELARRLRHAFDGARYFERLLTRFSVPEELFGPLSLKALEDDRYERLADGYLPTAGIAFLDEVFKANSAILNTLLTLLNEREFDNGTQRVHAPLIALVGATNEVPVDDALMAFHDRFLLRVPVAPVGDAAFEALLQLGATEGDGGGGSTAMASATGASVGTRAVTSASTSATKPAMTPVVSPVITPAMRNAIAAARERVDLGDAVPPLLVALRAHAAAAAITVSDRRWRQLVRLLRTQAATLGRARVEPVDLWLVPYVVADKPEHVEGVHAWFVDTVMRTPRPQAPWLTRAVEAFEKQHELETTMQQDDDGVAGKLALARAIGMVDDDGSGAGPTRIVSATLEARLRKRYSPLHLEARVAQVDEVRGPLADKVDAMRARAHAARAAMHGHLWLPPSMAAAMGARFDAAVALLEALQARLDAVRAGFAALPVDPALATQGTPPRVEMPLPA